MRSARGVSFASQELEARLLLRSSRLFHSVWKLTPPAPACLCLSSDWTLGSPLNSASCTSPPRKINRQTGWKEKETLAEFRASEYKLAGRQADRQKVLQVTVEDMLWSKLSVHYHYHCYYLLFLLLSHQFSGVLCALATTRRGKKRSTQGDPVPQPAQTVADTTLIPVRGLGCWKVCIQEYLLRKQLATADVLVWNTTQLDARPHSHRCGTEPEDPWSVCMFSHMPGTHTVYTLRYAESWATYSNNTFFSV